MDPNTTADVGFSPSMAGEPKKQNGKLLMAIIVFAVGAAAVFFLMSKNQKTDQTTKMRVTPSPTIVEPTIEPTKEATPSGMKKPTPTTTPTPVVVNKVQDLNIQILNGSGVVGAASSVSATLKKKGYNRIETGNADNYDYQNLTIRIKDSYKKFLKDLQNDLSEYAIGSQSGTLTDSALFDATLTVGK